jgi:hypothetical protein
MICDFLATDLKNCSKNYPSLIFFKRNLISELILYTVIKNHKTSDACGFEELFNEICPKYGSRNTVKQIVETAIIKKFFMKTENVIDKRSMNIRPTELTSNEFNTWQKEYVLSISQYLDYFKKTKI